MYLFRRNINRQVEAVLDLSYFILIDDGNCASIDRNIIYTFSLVYSLSTNILT